MSRAYTFRNVTEALPVLCLDLHQNGAELSSRNGRVKELTNVQITLTHPTEREVQAKDRHASLAAQIAETMWVLAGRNDVEWLQHYLPRAGEFSDDGKTWRAGYGPRIRRWKGMDTVGDYTEVDQVREVIEILREDPASRRAVINIFDPAVDFLDSKDIPCNNWLHFLNRDGRLNLHVAVRSNDLIWGWSGINAFEWSVLQEIVASCLGVMVGTLTFSISSLHLYEQHWAKAEKIAAGENDYWGYPLNLRQGVPSGGIGWKPSLETWDSLVDDFFNAEKVVRDTRGGGDSAIRAVKHPSIRSMLRVIQRYWGGDIGDNLKTLALAHAMGESPNGGVRKNPAPVNTPFIESAIAIHNDKHAAYGDSWKKRGEAVSIQANIARKVDRLGNGNTDDETQADTALDLLVYLAKYDVWLDEQQRDVNTNMVKPSDGTEHPNAVLRSWDRKWQHEARDIYVDNVENFIKEHFENLLAIDGSFYRQKREVVEIMAHLAYALARYWADQAGDQYRGADVD